MTNSLQIAQRFSAAAPHYQRHAAVQQRSAQRLVDLCQQTFLSTPPHLVDVGCGTGFVTELYARAYSNSDITALDLAPGMVQHCVQRLAAYPNVRGVVADGAHLPLQAKANLLTSSLCLQWFSDWRAVLRHWALHAQHIALSVPVVGSFSAWQQAHERAGQSCGLLALPDAQALQAYARTLGEVKFFAVETDTTHYPKPLDFAHDLRGLGADTPNSGHRAINLRRVLHQLPQGVDIDYRIAYLLIATT
jgi:malonyl-CoA O-methyltransferase